MSLSHSVGCSKRSVQVRDFVTYSNTICNTKTSYKPWLYSRRAVWTQHTRTATISCKSNWEGRSEALWNIPTQFAIPIRLTYHDFTQDVPCEPNIHVRQPSAITANGKGCINSRQPGLTHYVFNCTLFHILLKKAIKIFSTDADTFLTRFINFINSVATF